MPLRDDLHTHLSQFVTAPYLFVGSGLSRRYVHSDTWEGLLRRFADQMGKPYARYASKANGDFPAIATALASDYFDFWWDDDRFEVNRILNPEPVGPSSPLKYEISEHLSTLTSNLPTDGALKSEIDLLKKSVIQGVITTNYDAMLEEFFPGFTVFTGQEELLFNDPLGVGEIYKIHGSSSKPESLVLTTKDYQDFEDKNAYLAAKLLTVFVEHPVIFLGYSLTDSNVREIISSIAKVLSKDNIGKLQDRLIFVQWDPKATTPQMVPGVFPVGDVTIPMWQLTVPDFSEVFEALSMLKPRFPVGLLRRVKEQITELVRTSDPANKTYVVDFDESVNIADVDVVIGVGLQRRLELQPQGIVGLGRRDLMRDVLDPELDVTDTENMKLLVDKVLPKHLSGRTNTPIYRYLRASGYLNSDGLPTVHNLHAAVQSRIIQGPKFFIPQDSYIARRSEVLANSAAADFEKFVSDSTLWELAQGLSSLAVDKFVMPVLRDRLRDELASNIATIPTDLARAICIYDMVANRLEG